MNKTQRQIRKQFRKAKKNGGIDIKVVKNQNVVSRSIPKVAYVHKKKAKPFPCPKPDETLTVREQMELLGYVPKSV